LTIKGGRVPPQKSGVHLIDTAVGGLDPGLPLVVEGESGTGRSALSLQAIAATLALDERVVVLTAESPVLLLYSAKAMGIDMNGSLRDGRLRLFELDPEAAATLRAVGPEAFLSQLSEVVEGASLFLMDSLTDITSDLLDEASLRGLLNGFVERFRELRMLLTVEADSMAKLPTMRRLLLNGCGAYVVLERLEDGARSLRVERTRVGDAPARPLAFRIGDNGAELLDDAGEQRTLAVRAPTPTPAVALPCPVLLLVESDPGERARYCEWLGDLYDVDSAADGTAALGAFIARRPDVVVLSLDGRSGGYDVLRTLGATAEWLPILVLVDGSRGSSERIRPLVLGASDVVVKPVDRLELAHKVDTLLQLSAPPSHSVDLTSLSTRDPGASGVLLDQREFCLRLDRVRALGRRVGLASTLLAIRCSDCASLDAVMGVADETLRAEDAVHVTSDRSALLLLVGTTPEQASPALRRIEEACRTRGELPRELSGEFLEIDGLESPETWVDLPKNPRSWADLRESCV
jgi:DNA-binding response OmpR family regulator/KaiC/GvpD/RAD55 family RecA-like ATPase